MNPELPKPTSLEDTSGWDDISKKTPTPEKSPYDELTRDLPSDTQKAAVESNEVDAFLPEADFPRSNPEKTTLGKPGNPDNTNS